MQNLIISKKTPAVLVANFEEYKAALQVELKKYDIVVTADTVVDAKKLATELNSSKKVIKDAGKSAFDEATAPANAFKSQVAELVDLVESARQTILAQVTKFENETRKKVTALLGELRAELWAMHQVKDEFKSAEFDDLILLGNLTGKGALTKSAKDTLEGRVRDDKALQDKIAMRLLMLENQSFRAGLTVPLTEDHVATFLRADDATYQRQLDRIIASEIERQEQTEKRVREQMEKQQQAAPAPVAPAPAPDHVQQVKEVPHTAAAPIAPVQEPKATAKAPSTGKVQIEVTATFSLEVGEHITDAAIAAELRRVMEKAGINSLASVEVTKRQASMAA